MRPDPKHRRRKRGMFVPDGLLEELCQRLDKEGAGDWRRKLMQKEYGRLHLAVMAEPY